VTTNIIGIKEFRKNITTLWKKARKDKTRYIVMHHSTPVFEVMPLSGDRLVLDALARDVAEAREQVKRGETYTHEEALKALGL
jgi:PHD/YefM family antitoxin component YafN of YafNO toxin-antitoxin module